MSKGEQTRRAIVDHALSLASTVGLEGLTIGTLADELSLSKSGLFAHFRSKENLQTEVIDAAAVRFVEHVLQPALKKPRGEPRVRAIFDRWLKWISGAALPGGCPLIAAASELDDRPGPVRDHFVATQDAWIGSLARAAQIAIAEGHFRRDLDAKQFAFEWYALMLGAQFFGRLLADTRAQKRTRDAFEALLTRARDP